MVNQPSTAGTLVRVVTRSTLLTDAPSGIVTAAMDLTHSAADEAFRDEARTWLEEHKPELPMPPGDSVDGFPVHREWERRLFDGGWAVVSWPKAYGGREASLWQWLIFEEEYYRAGLPQRVAQNGIFLLAP
jgi:alkylation response protein AidB-like acyl-CoA dehydrogenase